MTSLILPDTNRELSRQTGWVRAHWEALADHLLDSLVPYFSPRRLPGRAARPAEPVRYGVGRAGRFRAVVHARRVPDRRRPGQGL